MTAPSLPALMFSPSHATPTDPRDGLLHHDRYGWQVWSEGEWCWLADLPEDAVRLVAGRAVKTGR